MKWSPLPVSGSEFGFPALQVAIFNRAYILSLPPSVQALHIGEEGWLNDDGSPATSLDPGVRLTQGELLGQGGQPVDLWIDAEGMDPFLTMSVRMAYGQVENTLLNGSTRIVSINPSDYPPAVAASQPSPLSFNLVGSLQVDNKYSITPICLMLITHGQLADGDTHSEGGNSYKLQITQTLMGPTYLWLRG